MFHINYLRKRQSLEYGFTEIGNDNYFKVLLHFNPTNAHSFIKITNNIIKHQLQCASGT
jgi:hypothetical protein